MTAPRVGTAVELAGWLADQRLELRVEHQHLWCVRLRDQDGNVTERHHRVLENALAGALMLHGCSLSDQGRDV